MLLARDSRNDTPVVLSHVSEDTVTSLSAVKTRSRLDIPDPLTAAVDADYGQRLVRLLGEFEANFDRLAAPNLTSELPAQLTFVTGWVSRVADFVSESAADNSATQDVLAAAQQCLVDAGALMPTPGGWKSWFGLGEKAQPGQGSRQIAAIKQSVQVIEQLFTAAAGGFRAPELAAEWVATVALFGKEVRRHVRWMNSSPK